jgi:uncharacterized membrane protein
MRFKTVQTVEWIVCIILPIILAVTIIFKIWYLPLIFFFVVVVLFGILISRIKEVYEDEMTRTIEEKGGHASVTIGSTLMVLAGVILLAISGDNTSGMGIAAVTLFGTSYGLSIINLFTRLYYKRKLVGKNG